MTLVAARRREVVGSQTIRRRQAIGLVCAYIALILFALAQKYFVAGVVMSGLKL
jgi:ABC-type glycerol-3-phosphate transport system permease component